MDKPKLGISWFNGVLQAAIVDEGRLELKSQAGTPGPRTGVDSTSLRGAECYRSVRPSRRRLSQNDAFEPTTLSRRLAKVISALGFEAGGPVCVIMSDARLVHQHIDVPSGRSEALIQRYMQRKVDAVKPFDEAAAWSFRRTPAGEPSRGGVLTTIPRSAVDAIVSACQENRLHPTRVVVPAWVLEQQLRQLPLDPAEITLIAAETEGLTCLVIGKRDGTVYLARSFRGSARTEPERVAEEVNRSLVHAEQRFTCRVERCWWFGEEMALSRLKSASTVPFAPSPVPYSSGYWLEQAITGTFSQQDNLLSVAVYQEPNERVFLNVTWVLIALLTLFSLITVVTVEFTYAHQTSQTRRMAKATPPLRGQLSDVREEESKILREVGIVRSIREDPEVPRAPVLFTALAGMIPEDLVLTNFSAARRNGIWNVRMDGKQISPERASTSSIPGFLKRLSGDPWWLEIGNTPNSPTANKDFGRPLGSRSTFHIEGSLK